MPQATPELTAKIETYFGETGACTLDNLCEKYLKEQGYKEERFQWHPKPEVKTYDDMTQQEYDCMCYLITEWDWGGLIK